MARHEWSELRDKVREDPARSARVVRFKEEMENEISLAELRKARQLTQVQLAQALDTNQSGVSRIEHQTDLYVSTLRSFVEALGGRLELAAVFDNRRIRIGSFEGLSAAEGETPDAAAVSR